MKKITLTLSKNFLILLFFIFNFNFEINGLNISLDYQNDTVSSSTESKNRMPNLKNKFEKSHFSLIKSDTLKTLSRKGTLSPQSNTITFTPTSQDVSGDAGTDIEATIQLNCTGSAPGFSSYFIYPLNLPDNGFVSVSPSSGNLAVGDVEINTFIFNLNVTSETVSTYVFRADWYDENGGFHQKDLTINVTYFYNDIDTDGDGVFDSEDDCPNQPGPASNNGCPICELSPPNNVIASNISSNSMLISWNNVPNNNGYRLTYRIENSTISAQNVDVPQNVNEYNLQSLTEGVTYKIWLKSKCNNNEFGSSSINYFGTACNNSIIPNNLYSYFYNEGNSQVVALNWDSNGNTNDEFHLQYRPINTTNWIERNNLDNTYDLLYNLDTGITFEWRVRNKCGNLSYGNWSNIENFTIVGGSCADAPFNLNTQEDINFSVWLTWNNDEANTSGFHTQYRNVSSSIWNNNYSNSTETLNYLTNLQASTTYEWRVRNKCSNTSYGDWSTISNFTTSSGRYSNINLKVYPNPVKDVLFLDSNYELNNWKIKNLSGKTLLSNSNKISKQININTSTLSSGLYVLTIQFANGKILNKQIVKK